MLRNSKGEIFLWIRYGRVGYDGVPTLAPMSLDSCIKEYNKKYKEKTGKGYTEVKMKLGSAGIGVKLSTKEESKHE